MFKKMSDRVGRCRTGVVALFVCMSAAASAWGGDAVPGRIPAAQLESELPADAGGLVDPQVNINAKPSEAEVERFYFDHPELFDQRRLYKLREFTVPVTQTGTRQALIAKLYRVKAHQAFEGVIAKSGLKYVAGEVINMAAENLPMKVVGSLNAIEPGHALFITTPDGFKALFVVAALERPVSLDQARPAIVQYLTNTRRREAGANGKSGG